jgi:sodium-dependent dicarboxylate transporter 2/3/5
VPPIVATLPEGDRARKAMVLGVAFAANLGGMGTPIGTPPNALALKAMPAGEELTFLQWMLAGVPIAAVMTAVAFVVLRLWFRTPTRRVTVPVSDIAIDPGRWRDAAVLVTLALTVVGWLTTGLHGLSNGTVALLPIVVLYGLGVLPVHAFRKIPWEVLILFGGGLCLGEIMKTSGLAAFAVSQVPVDGVAPWVLIAVLAALACGLSTLMSNTATAALVMPLIAGLPLADPAGGLATVALACSMAMALPISTPPNALAFSTGDVRTADMLGPGLVISIIGVLIATTAGQWWFGVVLG